MNRLLDLPLRAPAITLAAMLAITAFLGFHASRIRVDSSIENLLPVDDPDKRYYDEARATFGDEEISVIGVFADDVFAPATLAKIDRLSTRLAAIDGVDEVLSLTTVKGVEVTDFGLNVGRMMRTLPGTVEQANALRARVLGEPLYRKNVVSADGRATAVTLVFDEMTDEEFIDRGIEGRIRELVAEMGGPEQYAITGIPTIKVHGARLMEGDTRKFTPLALLVVILVLVFAFRTPRGVIVPLSTVVIGVVWTSGVMVLMNTPINMGTVVLNPLLMVIGVAAGIHIVSEYYLELEPGRTRLDVVQRAMRRVSMPVLIAATTTLIGFGSLILTPVRAVREFGIYSVFGIGVIVLAAFTVAPAALVLWPLPKRIPPRREESGWLPRALQVVGVFSVRHRLAVLACTVLVIALALWGIGRIQVETDYIGFFSEKSFVRIDNALIAERLAGTQPIYVTIDGDVPQAATRLETLTAMRDLQEFIDRQPGVDKTMSLLDYIRIVRRALQPGAPEQVPGTQAEIDEILMLLDPKDVRAVVTRDFSRANVIVRTKLSRSSEVGELVRRIEAFAADRFPRDIRVRPTGTMVLLNRSADALAWGQLTGLWQELVVLLCLLAFMFLSIRVGIMALIPNVVPTVILYGIMGWMGISLNISTSMIAAIAIGIAIDDTIHLLSSFNAELHRTGSQEQAIIHALGSVGQAAFFIATALSAGFFIVCLSSFKPVQHFGLLSGITMGIALVVELFLTPALVTTTKIITVWDVLFLKLGPDPHKQIPLFAGLGSLQAKLVVLMGRLASAARGSLITRRGDLKPELYVLLNGRVDVRRNGGPVIQTLARGDVVGEMGLVRRHARSADVVAAEDTDYLVLDERFLQRLRRQYPRTAAVVFLNLTRILSDRLESTTDALTAIPLGGEGQLVSGGRG